MEENRKEQMDSGISSLLMIAAYYGVPVNEENIKHT